MVLYTMRRSTRSVYARFTGVTLSTPYQYRNIHIFPTMFVNNIYHRTQKEQHKL